MTTFRADFGGRLREFADKVGTDLNTIHKEVATDLFTQIIYDTPVDTGLLVSNWQASMGGAASGVLDIRDPSRQTALAGVKMNITADASQPAWLTNNVPYGQMLEYGATSYGFSKKAPAGFVRLNISKFQSIVEKAIRELNK